MKAAIRMLSPLLVVLALPALAQTFAPAPKVLAPAAAAHPCNAPPQGQGPSSAECKRECERNPQATQCPRPGASGAAPNWSAPTMSAPPAAAPAAVGMPPASSLPATGSAMAQPALPAPAPSPARSAPAPTLDPGPPGGTPIRLPKDRSAPAGSGAAATRRRLPWRPAGALP